MRHEYMLAALLLAGCASEQMPVLEPDVLPRVSALSCAGRAARNCKFINSPVKLSSKPVHLPDGPYPFFKTRNDLKFVDADGSLWIAPAGILTDGASIPPLFVAFIGNPRSKQFMNAATVHDSYCARSNANGPYYHTAPWQRVHRMFYDGLIASGTSPIKAKIMYAAVYLGGPRWKKVRKPPRRRAGMTGAPRSTRLARGGDGALRARLENGVTITAVSAGDLRAMQSDTPLPDIFPKERLIAAFKRAKAHIKASNPPINALEVYLTQIEHDLFRNRPVRPRPGRNFIPGRYIPEPGGDADDGSSQSRGNGHSGGGNSRDGGHSGGGNSRDGGHSGGGNSRNGGHSSTPGNALSQ